MPFYPTDQNRARRSTPNRSPAWRPSRNIPPARLPTPANDNPRNPIPGNPANDNPPKPGRASKWPRRMPGHFRRLAPALGLLPALDWAWRRLNDPDGPPDLPDGWYLVHGPNTYGIPYARDASRWGLGFFDSPPSGPQTGLITGQSISPSFPTFQEYIDTYYWFSSAGWWIDNDTGDRQAQYMAFKKPLPWETADPDWLPAKNLGTRRIAVPLPDPFAPPLPWRGPGDPGHGFNPNPLPRQNPRTVTESRPEELPGQPPREFPAAEPVTPPILILGNELIVTPRPLPEPVPGSSYPVEEFVSESQPGRNPRNWRRRTRHRKQPPRKKTRERKGVGAKRLMMVLDAFGVATEGMDLIDSAWKAIPKELRTKSFHNGEYVRPAWWKRARDVWDHYDEIDLEEFVKNVIANQMEDYYIGMQSKWVNPTGQFGRTAGINQFRRENRDTDPTAPPEIDFREIVDQFWPALGG